MGREVGGGIGMGKTYEPKAFSFQCMTKFNTNKKLKNIYIQMKNHLYMGISQKCIIYPVTQMITDKATNSVPLGEYN